MRIALQTLKTLLESNVLEIKFTRRKPKPGAGRTRRMFCTTSNTLLNSDNGRRVLGFEPTNKPLRFNPAAKNLVVVWDLFKRGNRMVNVDSCDLIATIPANDEFWRYYNENLSKMTAGEMENFYDI